MAYLRKIYQSVIALSPSTEGSTCKQMMMSYLWKIFLIHIVLLGGNICLVAVGRKNPVRAERLSFLLLFLLCDSLTFGATDLGLV